MLTTVGNCIITHSQHRQLASALAWLAMLTRIIGGHRSEWGCIPLTPLTPRSLMVDDTISGWQVRTCCPSDSRCLCWKEDITSIPWTPCCMMIPGAFQAYTNRVLTTWSILFENMGDLVTIAGATRRKRFGMDLAMLMCWALLSWKCFSAMYFIRLCWCSLLHFQHLWYYFYCVLIWYLWFYCTTIFFHLPYTM
jgi:hypothetical protein